MGRIGIVSRVAFAAGGVLILPPEVITSLLGAAMLAAVVITNPAMGRRCSGTAAA